MAVCLCREEILDDQESVLVPVEYGGGQMHTACWDAVFKVAQDVIRAVDGGSNLDG